MKNYYIPMDCFYWFAPSAHPPHGYIKLSVIINKKRSVFSTGVFCRIDHWQPGRIYGIKGVGDEVDKNNEYLRAVMKQAKEIHAAFRKKKIESTSKLVCTVLKYLETTRPSPDSKAESKIYEELSEDDLLLAINVQINIDKPRILQVVKDFRNYETKSAGTYESYTTKENVLEKYLKHIKQPDMLAEKFTTAEATKMCDYLKNTEGNSETTIGNYISHYKTALSAAHERGYISTHPMYNFKYKVKSKKNYTYLTAQEITALLLMNYRDERHNQLRDAFIFMCYTGLNYGDYVRLLSEHIERVVYYNEETGKNRVVIWLEKERQKTGVPIIQKLNLFAQQILNKYNRPEEMPKFKYQWAKYNIKRIIAFAGITKYVTLRTARKTYAQNRLNRGDGLEATAVQMGLSRTETIRYYAQAGRELVDRKSAEETEYIKYRNNTPRLPDSE